MEDNLKYFVLLFPIVGFGLLIGGMLYRHRLKMKIQSYMSVQGTIVENVARKHDASEIYHHPVVEYIVYGKMYSVESFVGYGRKKQKGTKAKIMYDPNEPSTASIVKGYYFVPNVLVGIGAMFLFLGSLAWYAICLNP